MGVYVYSIKKASRRTVEFDGQKTEAATLAFHYKPGIWGFQHMERAHEASIARIKKGWGDETPALVVIGVWKEGSCVQAWPKGQVTWTDCNPMPGHTVGHLARKGRGWCVVTANS